MYIPQYRYIYFIAYLPSPVTSPSRDPPDIDRLSTWICRCGKPVRPGHI